MNKPKTYQERNKSLKRSHNYRERYFEHNKGHIILPGNNGGIYFCPYCGKPMYDKDKIVADHIHAVRRVQYTKELRERFKALPDGVNDLSNLVACCHRCNGRKGKKGGMWVYRAKNGVYFMPIARFAAYATVIWVAWWFMPLF